MYADEELLNDSQPHTEGWYFYEYPSGEFLLYATQPQMLKYRGPAYVKSLDGEKPFHFTTHLEFCLWCGGQRINPKCDLHRKHICD